MDRGGQVMGRPFSVSLKISSWLLEIGMLGTKPINTLMNPNIRINRNLGKPLDDLNKQGLRFHCFISVLMGIGHKLT